MAEQKAFIRAFVKEIVVTGKRGAVLRYTLPLPPARLFGDPPDPQEIAGAVLASVPVGGPSVEIARHSLLETRAVPTTKIPCTQRVVVRTVLPMRSVSHLPSLPNGTYQVCTLRIGQRAARIRWTYEDSLS